MARLSDIAPLLAETSRAIHARGWAFGTAGNFSAVVRRDPLVLASEPEREGKPPREDRARFDQGSTERAVRECSRLTPGQLEWSRGDGC